MIDFPVQASGYGSGDDSYDDMEEHHEVKKVVEEREFAMVCNAHVTPTHTQALTERESRLSAELLPFSVAELA